MKKICLVIQTDISGTGVSTYIKSIISYFNFKNKKKYNLKVITADPKWMNYHSNSELLIEKKHINFLRFFFVFFQLKRIGKYILAKIDPYFSHINSEEYDLILFPTASSLTYFSNKPSIVCVHDLMHIYERRFKESGILPIFIYRQNIYKNISRNFSFILVDSLIGKNQFIESYKCDDQKIKILEFCCPSYIINSVSKLKLSEYGQFLFYPAAFWPHKNHKNLILAFNKIKNRYKNLNLVLAGKKVLEYNRILRLVKQLDLTERVFFTGYIDDDDLKSYYLKAKGLIMPTFYGPTNIPPIEAATLNCPVLVSDIYGMKNQMEDYALYFNPLDYNSISKAIERLLSNSFKIPKNDKLKYKFSLERFVSRFDNIMHQFFK